jgi:hypothetical protein
LAANIKEAKQANKRYIPIAKKLDEEVAQKLNGTLDTPDLK